MKWRRKRTVPSVTELARVERILEREPALRPYLLGPKSSPARKRTGEIVYFAEPTVTVALEMMAKKLSPERAHVRQVLRLRMFWLSQQCNPGV